MNLERIKERYFKEAILAMRDIFTILLTRLSIPKKGDFLVNEKYLFEVGGKSKGFKQIKDLANSYVVADDIEIGSGNKIPLWLFGFMY